MALRWLVNDRALAASDSGAKPHCQAKASRSGRPSKMAGYARDPPKGNLAPETFRAADSRLRVTRLA